MRVLGAGIQGCPGEAPPCVLDETLYPASQLEQLDDAGEQGQPEEGHCQQCPECGGIVELLEYQQHEDWHYAQRLQREEDASTCGRGHARTRPSAGHKAAAGNRRGRQGNCKARGCAGRQADIRELLVRQLQAKR